MECTHRPRCIPYNHYRCRHAHGTHLASIDLIIYPGSSADRFWGRNVVAFLVDARGVHHNQTGLTASPPPQSPESLQISKSPQSPVSSQIPHPTNATPETHLSPHSSR